MFLNCFSIDFFFIGCSQRINGSISGIAAFDTAKFMVVIIYNKFIAAPQAVAGFLPGFLLFLTMVFIKATVIAE
jgi:hypothetical protein